MRDGFPNIHKIHVYWCAGASSCLEFEKVYAGETYCTVMKLIIGYESYHGNTRTMAYAFERGAREAGGETTIKHIRQIQPAEIKRADVIVIASPTYHKKPPSNIRHFMNSVEKLDLANKRGFVLGSYEQKGEAVEQVIAFLTSKGVKVEEPSIKLRGKPTYEELQECEKRGREMATG
jgi:flavorubredoxin